MASRTLYFLTSSRVTILHALQVARAIPTQPDMLESATLSPVNTHSYEEQTDVFHLAAILAQKIMKNHAFQDGNKRTALIAADIFLQMNGFRLEVTEPPRAGEDYPLTTAHVRTATNQMGVEELAAFYKSVAKSIETSTPGTEKPMR
ncbi:DOC family protein [Phyllosticta citribraziliensis]|uniref:DOC family protein n=1 Tax=Phyllosticta citribraziliensis TaxID=989973 RepID=A0ABR1LZ91_9PEZI